MAKRESLNTLLEQGRLKNHKASPKEIQSLFAVSRRDLEDAAASGLSDDNRFTIAYNAALQASRAILAAEGYRTSSGGGHHAATFNALRGILHKDYHHYLDYFNDCRSKRNLAEYIGTDIASSQEALELIKHAKHFAALARDHIKQHHPHFLKK